MRIHVRVAHSMCSDKVGIFSPCLYYHHLILKPASWPTLQIRTLRLREVKGLLGEYNFATMIPVQCHIRIHTSYPSGSHCLYQLALNKCITEMRSSENGLVCKYPWAKRWYGVFVFSREKETIGCVCTHAHTHIERDRNLYISISVEIEEFYEIGSPTWGGWQVWNLQRMLVGLQAEDWGRVDVAALNLEAKFSLSWATLIFFS